ncbi:hypothetical protein [Arthrobacter monumenti]
MSEQPTTGRPVDHETLAEMLERSLSEIPGVIRLEPTLKSTMTRMRSVSRRGMPKWASAEGQTASTGRDGIHIRIDNRLTNLTIELATDISHSSVETAKAAQQVAVETIKRAGLLPGSVDVSILSIEGRAQ